MTSTTRNARLRADFEAGLTNAELTTKYGIKRQRIYAILKATGGTPNRPRAIRAPKPSERDQRLLKLKILLECGAHTKRSLAAILGVSRSTLNRYIATIEAVRK